MFSFLGQFLGFLVTVHSACVACSAALLLRSSLTACTAAQSSSMPVLAASPLLGRMQRGSHFGNWKHFLRSFGKWFWRLYSLVFVVFRFCGFGSLMERGPYTKQIGFNHFVRKLGVLRNSRRFLSQIDSFFVPVFQPLSSHFEELISHFFSTLLVFWIIQP